MGAYYAVGACGLISAILAYVSLIQEREMQAVFSIIVVVLCALVIIFFKLNELNENIKKFLEKNNTDT